jgi:hypothetical protein
MLDIFERAANAGQFDDDDALLAAVREMNLNDEQEHTANTSRRLNDMRRLLLDTMMLLLVH